MIRIRDMHMGAEVEAHLGHEISSRETHIHAWRLAMAGAGAGRGAAADRDITAPWLSRQSLQIPSSQPSPDRSHHPPVVAESLHLSSPGMAPRRHEVHH